MLVEIVLFVIMWVTNLNTSPYSATRGHLLIPICAAQTNLLKKSCVKQNHPDISICPNLLPDTKLNAYDVVEFANIYNVSV